MEESSWKQAEEKHLSIFLNSSNLENQIRRAVIGMLAKMQYTLLDI